MPIPGTITTRDIRIDIRNAAGGPASGTVDFINRHALRDAAGGLILAPGTYTATLVDGQATITLPVTDDPDVSPSGWAYTVRVATSSWEDRFAAQVPTGDGTPLELADIAPAVTPIATVTYALASALAVHEADMTAVHGIADTAALETKTGAQAKVDALAAALAGAYLALTGGTITGDLAVQGAGGKGYRLRVSGAGLDFEAAFKDLIVSVWSGANYTGTQRSFLRLASDAQAGQFAGRLEFVTALYGATVHALDPTTGVAELGGKNGLTPLRLCGRKATPGVPTTGAWTAGDVVLDSAGVWHLCTVGGTPGTWT